MNKKLIAAAIAAAFAAPAAYADATLYGKMHASIDQIDYESSGEDNYEVNSRASRLGFKGSEDLGNGMSAFFKLEYESDITEGDSLSGRDQYIGIKMERFGKLTFGTTSTAYKSPGSKIDVFYRTNLQSRTIGLQSNLHSGKGEEGHGRATNTIGYNSPNWSGFGLQATYTLDSTEADGEDDDPWSVGATYSGLGGLYVFASYVTTNASGDDDAGRASGAAYVYRR